MNIKCRLKYTTPGLFVSLLLAGLAVWISGFFPQLGAVCVAILLGLMLGNILPSQNRLEGGFDWVEVGLLPIAIALMGSELQLQALAATGQEAVLAVLPPMVLSILLAVPLGCLLGIGVQAAVMLGVGNSVCGSSAVLAAAPALKVGKHEVAMAIAAVNLMGTVGMFVLPHLAEMFHLTADQTANLIGGSLQAVGQVAASGFSISGTVGDHAIVVKMLRVVMIGPLVMLLHHLFHNKNNRIKTGMPRFPRYMLGFVAFAVLGSMLPSDHIALAGLRALAKGILVVAMVAVGARIHFRSLFAHGAKAMLLVAVLSVVQIGTVLLLVILKG